MPGEVDPLHFKYFNNVLNADKLELDNFFIWISQLSQDAYKENDISLNIIFVFSFKFVS